MSTAVDDGDDGQVITIDDDVVRTATLDACQIPTIINVVSGSVSYDLRSILIAATTGSHVGNIPN